MIFRPELAEKVMSGEKTQTRRLTSENPRSPWWRERCLYVPGRVYAVQPGRGKVSVGKLLVTAVESVRLGQISQKDARAEGFEDVAAFRTAWTEINGVWWRPAAVWKLTFEVAPPELPARPVGSDQMVIQT